MVDDASHDPAAVAEVAGRHGARLIALSENVGPAGARNAGIAEVRTPYVAFVDSDVVVDAAALRGLAGHFADPQVAAVGPRVQGVARSETPRRFERWDVDGLSLDLGAVPALVRPWSKVGWLPSACLVVRVADLEAGAFDEGRRVGEDVDLVWRLIRSGRHVRYDPAYVAGHDSRGTWSTWLGRKAFYGTGGAWLASRHGDWMAPAVLSPVPTVGALALASQRRWSLPVALGALALVRVRLGRTLPDTPDRGRLATELTAEVAVSTLRQGSHLLLRHWWPGAAVGGAGVATGEPCRAAALVWDLLDHREVPLRRRPRRSSRGGSTTSPTAPACGGARSASARRACSCRGSPADGGSRPHPSAAGSAATPCCPRARSRAGGPPA